MYLNTTLLKIIVILFVYSENRCAEKEISYDYRYKNYALNSDQDTVVLITAYNRPHYLGQCIASLEKNKKTDDVCFIFALDGGSEAAQIENSELVEKAKFKNKITLLRQHNYGCPKNHIDAQRFAFDWCRFKRVIVLQEDMEVSSHFISFMINFHTWAIKKYTNIGAVSASSFSILSEEDKKNKKNLVAEDDAGWLFRSYCIDSSAWNTIKPILYAYEAIIDKIPLTDAYAKARSKPELWKDSYKIKNFTDALLQNKTDYKETPLSFKSNTYGPWYFQFGLFNEDSIMYLSFYLHNLVKLRSIVPRAIHIGKFGISSESSQIEYSVLNQLISLDTQEEDRQEKEFIVIKDLHYDNFLALLGL